MHAELYADNFAERVQERMELVESRCEGCGVRRGALRLGRRSHEFYFVALHGAHPNHDPHNPEAEIRIWCPT